MVYINREVKEVIIEARGFKGKIKNGGPAVTQESTIAVVRQARRYISGQSFLLEIACPHCHARPTHFPAPRGHSLPVGLLRWTPIKTAVINAEIYQPLLL